MTTFEERIRAQQTDKDEYQFPKLTIGHLIRAILSIHDAATAKAFRDQYIEHLRMMPGLDSHGPEYVADANIGWCFGEGMPESDHKIWIELGSAHPVFGSMAFQMGVNAGRSGK